MLLATANAAQTEEVSYDTEMDSDLRSSPILI